MRVAVETTPLTRAGGDRGIGRYVSAVLAAVEANGWETVPIDLGPAEGGRLLEFTDLWRRRRRLRHWGRGVEVFHATTPFVVSLSPPGRNVTTILDTIPLDLPTYAQTGLKSRLFYRLAARGDRILTLSHFSAERIRDLFGVAERDIVVAPLPPSVRFTPPDPTAAERLLAEHGIERPFVASLVDVRTRDPRKRAEWLSPLAEALRARAELPLVVVGGGTESWDGRGGMRALGRVSDELAAAVFGAALVFVSTSAYEGQGLPQLEAMACGTPVVAMANTAIPEIVQGGGVLVEEAVATSGERSSGPERLAEACVELAGDGPRRETLTAEALRVAGAFTAERFAEGVRSAYVG